MSTYLTLSSSEYTSLFSSICTSSLTFYSSARYPIVLNTSLTTSLTLNQVLFCLNLPWLILLTSIIPSLTESKNLHEDSCCLRGSIRCAGSYSSLNCWVVIMMEEIGVRKSWTIFARFRSMCALNFLSESCRERVLFTKRRINVEFG